MYNIKIYKYHNIKIYKYHNIKIYNYQVHPRNDVMPLL